MKENCWWQHKKGYKTRGRDAFQFSTVKLAWYQQYLKTHDFNPKLGVSDDLFSVAAKEEDTFWVDPNENVGIGLVTVVDRNDLVAGVPNIAGLFTSVVYKV